MRVVPRAIRSQIAGIASDADGRAVLTVRVAAPPAQGAANAALVTLLAAALGVRKRDVEIVSGDTGRNKQVRLRGDSDALAERLLALCPHPSGDAPKSAPT